MFNFYHTLLKTPNLHLHTLKSTNKQLTLPLFLYFKQPNLKSHPNKKPKPGKYKPKHTLEIHYS